MLRGTKLMWLIAVLLLLVGLFLILKYTGKGDRSKSLHTELVTFHKEAVTRVVITSPEDTVILEKTGDDWKVGDRHAETTNVLSMLSTLEMIRPSRLASRSEDSWKDFYVDPEGGTRVQVFEGDEKTQDIVLGRFGVEGQNSFYSYVRLWEEPDVYVANDFMKMGVGIRTADYRNDDVLRFEDDSLVSIAFNYPDTAFVLSQRESGWIIGDSEVEASVVKKYLGSVHYTADKNFAEQKPEGEPEYTASFLMKSGETITVSSYPDGMLTSSMNTDEHWKAPAVNKKIFWGRSYFLKDQ